MTEPIITEADRRTAWVIAWSEGSRKDDTANAIALALAQARAEGRLAGMEEAARVADALACGGCAPIGKRIRARTTKEG